MSPRRDVPEQHRSLKTLFRALLARCGGLDAAASCVRVGRSQLANYTDMHSDQFAPLDVVAELEAVAGEPLVTAELARRASHLLVPAVADCDGPLAASMAHLAREMGEVFAAYATAMGNDGRVSAVEADQIERELGDVIRLATRALVVLRRAQP
jgi:hypothetical protein